ncbi:MAG: flavodoxin family protein [Dehalococcoidales bacterium]|nr:flavodoxin family protein [Dehalococcoidales bacterium]
MKTLVVYDSVYKNTENIAQAIGRAFASGTVNVMKADGVTQSDLTGINLLIVGSPTQGGRPLPAMQKFLSEIPVGSLTNINVAAFDTRMTGEKTGAGVRFIVKIFGFAAGRIATDLQKKGGKLVAPAEGFIVDGREGPLKSGESSRATTWAQQIAEKVHSH